MRSTTRQMPARDGTPLLIRRWSADGEPWATVVLVHGIAEHSGRYEHVGAWLAEAGLDVVAYDQRGFGASGGRRAHVDRWQQVHDDLADRLADAAAASHGGPVVLWGHSLGGLIALGYCVAERPGPMPAALVLSAPAVDSATPGWQRFLARVLTRVAPTLSVKNAFDVSVLSRDPAVGERYLADPLNQHTTTARFGAEAFAEQDRVRSALGRLTIPTYVYHGAADRLVPTVTSEPLAALPNVTRRTWPDLRHETHNEANGRDVIEAAVAWLRSVLQSADN